MKHKIYNNDNKIISSVMSIEELSDKHTEKDIFYKLFCQIKKPIGKLGLVPFRAEYLKELQNKLNQS